MERATNDHRVRLAAIGIAAIAVVTGVYFRLLHQIDTPLWLDEAYSRFAADRDFAFLWRIVPRYETHPPFYYSLLHLWVQLFGDSLVSIRLPGLLCGIAALIPCGMAAAALADLLGADRPARAIMIAFLVGFAALHPLAIQMSRQARPYSLMILVYAFAVLALLRMVAASHARNRLPSRWIAMFFTAQALMLWLHTLGALFALAMTLALAVAVLRPGLSPREWRWLAGGQMLAGLAYVPAFLIMIEQASTWVHATWLTFSIADVPIEVGFLMSGGSGLAALVGLVTLLAGGMRIWRRPGGGRVVIALLLLGGLPIVLSILISLYVSPVFLRRALSPVTIPFGLLMAATAALRYRLAAPLLLALLLGISVQSDRTIAAEPVGEDWYRANAWLLARIRPGDALWAYPNETALPLSYALMDKGRALPIRQIPAPVPALAFRGAHPTGTPGVVAMDARQTAALLATPAATAPHTIWLVGLAADAFDRKLAIMLARQRRPIASYRVNEITITGFSR